MAERMVLVLSNSTEGVLQAVIRLQLVEVWVARCLSLIAVKASVGSRVDPRILVESHQSV
jgi:hypothetical protein